ncbi:hypothetical protein [Mesorhizobium sp. L103C105A0]|uniref:hypothetical protein n=1 Tax=Mesorhizobium sp. L103C105A0 TaxID=1287074 RepID=UPI0003CFE20E|nr:hypothetical protein [Mesorhizobium sp. L103C105A0]ESZ78668.1 hypothetical protein X726_04140 [Mesorhizobium sp. L103C105A0]
MRITYAAFLLSLLLPGVSFADGCTSAVDRAVFDVLDEAHNGLRVGTATLVDGRNAIFLTALHLVGYKSLVLSRKEKKYHFDVIASGPNPTQVIDDWAVLQARENDTPVTFDDSDALNLLYDTPTPDSIAQSTVLTSSSSTSDVVSTKWSNPPDFGAECSIGNLTLTKVDKYDKGNSGSPYYSRDTCHVFALSSRFELPQDLAKADEKAVAALFFKYQQQLGGSGNEPPIDVAAPLDQQLSIIRTWLKNELFVKVVPMQCIINGVIRSSVQDRNGVISMLAKRHNNDLDEIEELLHKTNMEDSDDLRRLQVNIIRADINWSSLLLLWNDWYDGVLSEKIKNGTYTSTVRDFIVARSSLMQFQFVPIPLRRAYREIGVQHPQQFAVASGGGFAGAASDFVKDNAGWSSRGDGPKELKVTPPPGMNLPTSAEELLKTGRQLAKLADEPIEGLSVQQLAVAEATKKSLQDISIVYLASGLSKAQSASLPTIDFAESYALLASNVSERYSGSSFSSPQAGELATELASRSLDLTGHDIKTPYSEIATRVIIDNAVLAPYLHMEDAAKMIKILPDNDKAVKALKLNKFDSLSVEEKPLNGIVRPDGLTLPN